jgi:hypothetical protein
VPNNGESKIVGLINALASAKGNLAAQIEVSPDNQGELTGVVNAPKTLRGVVQVADKYPYIAIVSKTVEEWRALPQYMSVKNSLYIYSDYRREIDPETGDVTLIPRMKIGDGVTYVADLPFTTMSITQDDIDRWNSKSDLQVTVDEDEHNLIFYNNVLGGE